MGVAILISDKADFRARKVTTDKGALHDNRGEISKKTYQSLLCMHLTTGHQQVCEAKTKIPKRRNR